jgi:hypothetical protein
MASISSRFAPHLCGVLLPALAAVAAHRYVGFERDDCIEAARLTSGEAPRQAAFREVFGAFQSAEGPLPGVAGRFAILRSRDPKRLYHHPELFFVRGAVASRTVVEWLQDGSEQVPIHRVHYGASVPPRAVAYLLIYHSRPVDNPYRAQLAAAPGELLGGPLPMTLAFVSAEAVRGDPAALAALARDWLLDFWRRYKTACH